MKNGIQPGDTMTFTAPSGGVVSGAPVLIGALLVVPVATVAEASKFAGETKGVFSLVKPASQAWTEGQILYWDNSAKKVTSTAASNYRCGVAAEAVSNAAGNVLGKVRLDGISVVVTA